MRNLCARAAFAAALSVVASTLTLAAECENPNALGVSRTITVDPVTLPLIGTMSYKDTLPLADHEVVLTFDDGPIPPHTGNILDILASECVKATYFMVGEMATAHPEWARKVAAAGHTIGTHSETHPLTFRRMPLAKAQEQIDQGFASVQKALGDDYKVAPFFRYPGLMHKAESEAYLAEKGIMVWSADFPGDDWKRRVNAKEVTRRSISRLEARGRGVLLLHDIHKVTVIALPDLLAELKARGFKVVHVVPGATTTPLPEPAIAEAKPDAATAAVVTDPAQAPVSPDAPAAAATAAVAIAAAHPVAPSKDLSGAPERAAPMPVARPSFAKSAARAGFRGRAHRTAALRAHQSTHGVRHAAVHSARPKAQQAQRAQLQKTNRSCANCRVIRVKKAHLGTHHAG
jgi:peptidoglycan/xylan/chitin deacetylase (PgdA/CDA1 family)